MNTLGEIADALETDPDAAAALADFAQPVLDDLTPGVTIGSTTLLQRMGAKYHQLKPLSRWLYAARFDGLLDGYWTTNEKRRTFGKSTTDWHCAPPRKEMTKAEKKVWFKENAPEEYAKIYKD